MPIQERVVLLSAQHFGQSDVPLTERALEASCFIGSETPMKRFGLDMAYWREKLFVAMFRNAGSATTFFQIPSNRVVELGTQVVL